MYQVLIRKRCFLPVQWMDTWSSTKNTSIKYYYQGQQQMFVTQKSWVDLLVKGVKNLPGRSIVDTEGVVISTENFNPEFWSSVLPKLEAFYNEYFLVGLANPRVKFGLSRLEDVDGIPVALKLKGSAQRRMQTKGKQPVSLRNRNKSWTDVLILV